MEKELRIVLIIVSVLTVAYIFHKIRRAKLKIEYSLFWIGVSALLVLLSLFPQIAYAFSNLLGFMSPVNFIFLFMIFILLINSFFLTNKVSQLENMIHNLTQKIAVDKTMEEDRTKSDDIGEEE